MGIENNIFSREFMLSKVEMFLEKHPKWLIFIITFLFVFILEVLPGPQTLDDAFITYRYARNLSQGLGFVYNPGERVQGSTTPLYTLVLAGISAIFGSEKLPWFSLVINAFADTASIVIFFQICKNIFRNQVTAFVASFFLLLQPLRVNVAGGGMETSLFILFILGMYERYLNHHDHKGAAILAALVSLTRADGILAVGPLFLYLLWKDRTAIINFLVIYIVLILPWYLWASIYFGSPFPHSILAKKFAYASYTQSSSAVFVMTFLGTGTVGPYRDIFLIIPGLTLFIGFAYLGIRKLIITKSLALIIISYPILYFLTMIVVHPPLFFIWYYPPLIPGLLLILFSAMESIILSSGKKWIFPVICYLLAFEAMPAYLLLMEPGWGIARNSETMYAQVCSHVNDAISDDQVVFAPDIGVIGWCFDNQTILDPIGLVSPISITYMQQYGGGLAISPYLVNNLKPDYVISREDFIQNLIDNNNFQTAYELVDQVESSQVEGDTTLIYRLRVD